MRPTTIALACLFSACAGAYASTKLGEATVLSLDAAPVRISPSKQARIRILARGQQAFVGKLEMDPGAKVPLHRDSTEEYIHVLEGSGKMTIDGKRYDVAPGVTIYMPANAEVSFENGPHKMSALQVFADPEPSKKYDAWTPAR
jgi:quercetin dioxygenase-like cupin family protein